MSMPAAEIPKLVQALTDLRNVIHPSNPNAASAFDALIADENRCAQFVTWISEKVKEPDLWKPNPTPVASVDEETGAQVQPGVATNHSKLVHDLSNISLTDGQNLSAIEAVELAEIIIQNGLDIDSKKFKNAVKSAETLLRQNALAPLMLSDNTTGFKVDDRVIHKCFQYIHAKRSVRLVLQRLAKETMYLYVNNIVKTSKINHEKAFSNMSSMLAKIDGHIRKPKYYRERIWREYREGKCLHKLGMGVILLVPARMGRIALSKLKRQAITRYLERHPLMRDIQNIWLQCMSKITLNEGGTLYQYIDSQVNAWTADNDNDQTSTVTQSSHPTHSIDRLIDDCQRQPENRFGVGLDVNDQNPAVDRLNNASITTANCNTDNVGLSEKTSHLLGELEQYHALDELGQFHSLDALGQYHPLDGLGNFCALDDVGISHIQPVYHDRSNIFLNDGTVGTF